MNELAAFLLVALVIFFFVHMVQGAAGEKTGAIQYVTSFFSRTSGSSSSNPNLGTAPSSLDLGSNGIAPSGVGAPVNIGPVQNVSF